MINSKILFFSAVLVSLAFSSQAQNDPFSKVDFPNGQVKSIEESGFDIQKINNKQQSILKYKSTRLFDKYGKITQEIIYGPNGQIFEKITYLYDKDGNKLSIKNLKGDIEGVSKVIRHKNGEKTIRTNFKSGNVIVNKYNLKNLKIEDLSYDGNNVLQSKVTYVYDDNDNQISRNTYSLNNNKIVNQIRFYYIKANKLIKMESRNIANLVLSSKTLKFDQNKLKSEVITQDSKGKVTFVEKFIYEKLDGKNNWIKAATLQKGVIKELRERVIIYY